MLSEKDDTWINGHKVHKNMDVVAFSVNLFLLFLLVFTKKVERTYTRLTKEISEGSRAYQTRVPKRSKLHCATACSQNVGCNSFSFNTTTKSCDMSCGHKQSGNLYHENGCPNSLGYTYLQHIDLCFRMEGDTGKTLPRAKAICESECAHLILIENQEVNQFLFNEIVRRGLHTNTEHFFIDGSDKDHEGVWKNYLGGIMAYVNMHQGEPDGGTGQNCLTMTRGRRYQWADAGCDDTYKTGGYICQINIY